MSLRFPGRGDKHRQKGTKVQRTITTPVSRSPQSKGRNALVSVALAAATLLGSAGSMAAPPERSSEGPWARHRVLVMPNPGLSESAVGKIVGAQGGKARKITSYGLYVVDLPANASEKATAALLRHNPHFKFAELDGIASPALAVNDPYFGAAWHLSKIGAPSAWDDTQGSGVTIAILDSGVNGAHVELSSKMVPGWNIIDNNSNTADFNGHGTNVAGAAAATTNNGIGVAGVAGQAKIMPLVITDSTLTSYYSVIAQAITYAADHGARVASISYSGLPFSSAVRSAAQYMKSKGGLVVVAAGNTGAVDNVAPTTAMIPVAATESDDSYSGFSTYGAFVAMSAPGSNIYSTSRSGGYGIYRGTSLSTPIVAGTVALMMAANPELSGSEIEDLLYTSAVDLGTPGRDPHFGYGRVDTAAAVEAAVNASAVVTNPIDATPPVASVPAPVANSTVSGWVPVSVSATDNVGVSKVELRINGALLATDSTSPYSFSWDSTKAANGMSELVATAYDAAGNSASSSSVAVNVANATAAADTSPPAVSIASPTQSAIPKKGLTIRTSASDDSGAAGITQSLYINGELMTTATGSSLSYRWNIRKLGSGTYTLQVVAQDRAGNRSTASKQVFK
jgi:subtilisin family serine protease